MKVFKSLGHFFANAIQKLIAVEPTVLADATAIEGTQAKVTAVTAVVPVYGPLAVNVENAGYAVLGELIAVLKAGGAAAEAKLADVGLDTQVIATVKAISVTPLIAAAAKLV